MDLDKLVGYLVSIGGMLAITVVPVLVALLARADRRRKAAEEDDGPEVVQGQTVDMLPDPRLTDLLEDALEDARRLQRRLDRANTRLGEHGEPPA